MKKIKICLTLTIILFLVFGIMNFVSGYFSDRVSVYISNKATIYCSNVIEEAIRDEVVSRIDLESLVTYNKDQDEVVKSIYINTKQVNDILSNVNKSISNNMNKIENEKLVLPLGIVLSETLFYDIGPDMTINIVPVGSAITDVVSKVSPYGINSSLFEVSINVKMKVETIIPLKKGLVDISFDIPLVIQIINSDVPRYYFSSKGAIPYFELD